MSYTVKFKVTRFDKSELTFLRVYNLASRGEVYRKAMRLFMKEAAGDNEMDDLVYSAVKIQICSVIDPLTEIRNRYSIPPAPSEN